MIEIVRIHLLHRSTRSYPVPIKRYQNKSIETAQVIEELIVLSGFWAVG